MGVDHNAHTEANGSRIENDANNNFQTRLGFRTFIRTQEKNSGPHGDDFEPFVEMWICPYISRHLLSLNPLLACCRRYSRGER